MPTHPRYKGRSFGSDDKRSQGWFSRRYRTGEAHEAAKAIKEARVLDQMRSSIEREKARKARGPLEQLKVLDMRLGKGKGAKKERARLKSQLENMGKPKPKAKKKKRAKKKKHAKPESKGT